MAFIEAPDHFFEGHLPEMGGALEKWLTERDAQ
jgi:hypothetical protein